MEGWRPGRALAEWEQTHGKKKAKCVLTSTGHLMEGVELTSGQSAQRWGRPRLTATRRLLETDERLGYVKVFAGVGINVDFKSPGNDLR
jgi:hypothetical protein